VLGEVEQDSGNETKDGGKYQEKGGSGKGTVTKWSYLCVHEGAEGMTGKEGWLI